MRPETPRDAPIQHRVGRLVDDRARVVGLEVDRLDRARSHQFCDQRLVPGARRVQLEAQPGVASRRSAQRLDARRLPEAQRDHEAHRPGLRPSASCSVVSAWRSARSSAADSYAQVR